MPKRETRKVGIYWLASYPRSGNTWVRLFLRAYMHGELDINAMEDVVLGIHGELHWQASTIKPVYLLQQHDRLPLLPAAVRNALFIANGKDVRFKTHDCNANMHGTRLTCPELTKGAVYVVRDPRDVACSYADYKQCTIDEAIAKMNDKEATVGPIEHHCYSWQYLGTWSDHVTSWITEIAPPNTVAVAYEDLLERPEELFPEIVKAIGLPDKGPEAVKLAIQETQFNKLQYREEKEGFVESEHRGERFFRKGEAGGWRTTLSRSQADRIVNDHGEVMEKLGYDVGVTA